jgi:hypothetical protein
MGKLLDNNVPVFIISFNTQEVLLFRNAKTGEITVGAEDKVEQCSYVAAITRVEEELDNELTGGWKVIDVSVTLSSHRSRFLTRRVSVVPDGKTIRTSISIERTSSLLSWQDYHHHTTHSSASYSIIRRRTSQKEGRNAMLHYCGPSRPSGFIPAVLRHISEKNVTVG